MKESGAHCKKAGNMIAALENAAFAAGKAILEIYRSGVKTDYKADMSPVTEADCRAETIILEHLSRAFPHIPIVAEEEVAAGIVPDTANQDFFLVDPLDGTREFIGGYDDFTVNIALIREGAPCAGIVYAPARNIAYTAQGNVATRLRFLEDGTAAQHQPVRVRPMPPKPVAVISRSHCNLDTEAFIAAQGIVDFTSVGSSLKFCLVAEGVADVYPRFSRTMLWDTAAGDAVLRAAGGMTVGPDGKPLVYSAIDDRKDKLANPSFVAWGGREPHTTA